MNKEKSGDAFTKLNRKYQMRKKKMQELSIKLRVAEQHSTFTDCFIDKLLKEGRVTTKEIKEFKKRFDYKTKKELAKEPHKRPHYKKWRDLK